jgi:hypothetical protein
MPIVVLLHDWTPKTAKQVSLFPNPVPPRQQPCRRFNDERARANIQSGAEFIEQKKKERSVL